MTPDPLSQKADTYLWHLCVEILNRRVGSPGNRAATDFFATVIASLGFTTESQTFDCIDWFNHGAELSTEFSGPERAPLRPEHSSRSPFRAPSEADSEPFSGQSSVSEAQVPSSEQTTSFDVLVSPYSLGCHVQAPLAIASTVQELENMEAAGRILLLRGEIAREQLMPKHFPFYNPEEHRRILNLLEVKAPEAIVAATSQNPELAGAVYPFPLIEDGDFDIPSVYMTEEEGTRLARHEGRTLSLTINAQRLPATGNNVIARKGRDPRRRVVLFAHIDAKDGTPGAIDNATGVVTLLLLAELLVDYTGGPVIEIVAMNGEDYYAASGEKLYLATNAGHFQEIILGINLDGVGYRQGHTAYSLYECPPDMARTIHHVFARHPTLLEGEPWYQSDHGLFLMHQVPAVALTSEHFSKLWTEIAHTPRDTPEIVDTTKLAAAARALRDLLETISKK